MAVQVGHVTIHFPDEIAEAGVVFFASEKGIVNGNLSTIILGVRPGPAPVVWLVQLTACARGIVLLETRAPQNLGGLNA